MSYSTIGLETGSWRNQNSARTTQAKLELDSMAKILFKMY